MYSYRKKGDTEKYYTFEHFTEEHILVIANSSHYFNMAISMLEDIYENEKELPKEKHSVDYTWLNIFKEEGERLAELKAELNGEHRLQIIERMVKRAKEKVETGRIKPEPGEYPPNVELEETEQGTWLPKGMSQEEMDKRMDENFLKEIEEVEDIIAHVHTSPATIGY